MPETIGPYEIVETCRYEFLGRVVRARHAQLQRQVYLKELCLPPSVPAPERQRLESAFRHECAALARIADPRVERPVDVGVSTAGAPFVAFDAPGASGLAPLPDDPRAFGAHDWLRLGVEAGGVLAVLSEGGLALQALDPACFFLSSTGAVRYVHLTFVSLLHEAGPACVGVGGATPYTAPEVEPGGAASPAALVFSLGAWLYRALSLDPFCTPAAIVRSRGTLEPLWHKNPQVSAAVDEAVRRALAPEPRHRYGSVDAFAAELSRCANRPAPVTGPVVAAGPSERTLIMAPREVEYPAWHYAAWAVGMGAAGCVVGWALGGVFPLP